MSETLKIKEVAATSSFLNRPLRSLNEVALAQHRMVELRKDTAAAQYAAFQKLRDLLRSFMADKDIRAGMSHEQVEASWAVLREAERF